MNIWLNNLYISLYYMVAVMLLGTVWNGQGDKLYQFPV